MAGQQESAIATLWKRPWMRNGSKVVFVALGAAILALALGGISYAVCGPTSAGTWYNKYWIGFFWSFLFLLGLALVFRGAWGSKPEYLYLAIVLTLTLFICWSLSAWQFSWDDGIHFRFVYQLAHGGVADNVNAAAIAISTTFDPATQGNANDLTDVSLQSLYTREGLLNEWASMVGEGQASLRLSFSSLCYVPCALVMFLCDLFGCSFTTTFVLAKVPCALIYSFMTFLGMRKLESGKMLFAVVALIPSNLFLAANYSYTYWTASCLLYSFAILASMIQRKDKVSIRSVVAMLVIFFLGCLPRPSYALLVFLFLLVPKARFKTLRASWIYRASLIGIVVLAVLVYCLPMLLAGSDVLAAVGDNRGGNDIRPAGQLAYILSDPIGYGAKLFHFLAPPFAMEQGLPDEEGAYYIISGLLSPRALPGWFTNYGYLPRPSTIFSVLVLVIMLFAALTDKPEDAEYGAREIAVSWILCFATMVVTITFMYMTFTNVGNDLIRGVQRRYMLPMVYPFFAFIGVKRWLLPGKRIPRAVYDAVIMGAMVVIFFASWWQSYIGCIN